MKKAVHFGAGNIGRGFIGLLLHGAGYEVVFADVVPSLIEQINAARSYRVITLDAQVEAQTVQNVRAVLLDSQECRGEIVDADLVTTAVGLGNLANVAAVVVDGLRLRKQQNNDQMLNIMACENAIRATTTLQNEVLARCDDELRNWITSHVGFADVAVDRIAPNRAGHAVEPLDSVVERYFEWDIETPMLKGALDIPGATFVEQLDPYLERKLFILNGAHATAAYAGYHKKYGTILEAMNDPEIAETVARVQREAIVGLVHCYPSLQLDALEQYAASVRTRFLNPHIADDVARVGRDPLRKLSAEDRLVRPLHLAQQVTKETPGIVRALALGFAYDNPEDAAAVQVQQQIQELGIKRAVSNVTGISDPVTVQQIVHEYQAL
ncbi:mannitol-1-phosphate 5-dehydrogenase [Alicyclobacillus fastidiosus]|uniref:Mannitol-1-phosphate 5-dehydrogenase n=1 Tax=Alicyclobacillus fastidiosus TaxID=392011 RepID=A0ABY6ZKE8_9BACL|nr:mannitol-1-phosphate 5-dehydrogenase [Alicyclobacillus fastidiosus]WAH42581.1 mannitol-1-phosphate 5-dehydrogenase [Alicyclobacillus fastidiosus]GMA64437.1 mannitol-1-phosphate 5-dehydrogenase [Alicyclobacillus fastidiosus]